MISLINSTLTLRNRSYPIVKWEVWFQTPFGLITNLSDALKVCMDNELDPNTNIIPVPVAVDDDNNYEVVYR